MDLFEVLQASSIISEKWARTTLEKDPLSSFVFLRLNLYTREKTLACTVRARTLVSP